MENCNEIFLSEVTHVELVPASRCSFPIPFNVGEITEMDGCTIGSPEMELDVSDDDADGQMTAPTLKTQEKPAAAGNLRNHDLQVPVIFGYDDVREARGNLLGRDFHAILRTSAGTEFLLYAVPNASIVSVEDQFGSSDPKQTVKVSLQSMSNMIKITRR